MPDVKPASLAVHAQPGTIHETIEIDRAAYYTDPAQVRVFREYAQGQHRNVLTEAQEDLLKNVRGNRFSDNVCHQIVAEGSDRIDFQRWDCEDDAANEWLSTLYTTANVADFAGETHYAALCDGNYAVSLAWDADSQRVMLHREPWWDGNTGVFVGYDAQGESLYAVKEWNTPDGRRRVVWYEDRLERYIGQGGAWLPFALPGDSAATDGSVLPQNWVKADGSPLHIPVIHFPNTGRRRSVYGTSELDGGVLGFQDQINDLQYDMTAAGRMTGFQMLFLSGVTPPKDAQGQTLPIAVGPGMVYTSLDPSGRGQAIPAGDIGQLINLYQTKLRAVSRMTRTPLHAITGGDWPSGEALLRAEMPAVNKAQRQINRFRASWAMVGHRATEIANTFGKAGLNEDALIAPVFATPDRRDPLSKSFVVKNLAGMISIREALRVMGYTPEQAETVYQEMEEEKDDMGTALLSRFDKGQGAGTAGVFTDPTLPAEGPLARVSTGVPTNSTQKDEANV